MKGLTISAMLSLVVILSSYSASINCDSEWIVRMPESATAMRSLKAYRR